LSDGMHPASLKIDLIEKNLQGFYSAWANAMNIPVVINEGMSLVYQKGNPWPAFILFPEIPEGHETDFVTSVVKKIAEGTFPSFLVCSDQEKNKSLMRCLENAGFRPVTIWSGMARSLHDPVQTDEIDNFQIQKVNNFPLATGFAQLINKEVFRASYLDAGYFQSPELSFFHAFAGSMDGEVCSTSSAFCQDTAAGLYFIATLPALRRKGLGKRMTLLAMKEAQKLGCNTLVLHATRAGRPLYEQLGFAEYCKIVIYWLPL
jgi:ribosomal protein S18 acetylase RimI-like enzyme